MTDDDIYYFHKDHIAEFLDFLEAKNYSICSSENIKICKYQLMSEWRESQGEPPVWDKDHDEFDVCECGHHYYRHFDTYEDMYACGCKYCDCFVFKAAECKPSPTGGETNMVSPVYDEHENNSVE